VVEWLAARHWGLRTGVAIVFGILTALGFQPYGWWPLVPVGVAGLSLCTLAAKRWWGAIGLGYAFGLGFMGLGVNWMQVIFLQAMVALVVIEAVWYAVLAGLIRLGSRTPWWPLLAAGSWVVVEFVFSRFPFDGFGWMRIGYAMVDSPLSWALPLAGVAGVGLLTALIAQGLAWLATTPSAKRTAVVAAGSAVLVGLSSTGLLVTAGQATGQVTVGWVQGGAPGGGVYGLGPARTITTNQVAETGRLFQRVDAGEAARPDFVAWPENSTDLDPFTDAETAKLIASALARTGMPILVGSVVNGPGADERQTVSLWWHPTNGVEARYTKRGIVPFGEWVPLRSLLLPLIPELAYVGAQSIAGTDPGVLDVTLPDGRPLKVGVIVCYDLAFDHIVTDTVSNGAQVLIVQSSNAMYQGTGQIDQQFAITRARAMELRREILVVTTSGVSGLIRPDGSVDFQTTDRVSASGVVTLPQRSGLTPAASWGGAIELGLVILTLAGLVVCLPWGRMAWPRRGRRHP
jgi:apolipoprotein N-acyltransferase